MFIIYECCNLAPPIYYICNSKEECCLLVDKWGVCYNSVYNNVRIYQNNFISSLLLFIYSNSAPLSCWPREKLLRVLFFFCFSARWLDMFFVVCLFFFPSSENKKVSKVCLLLLMLKLNQRFLHVYNKFHTMCWVVDVPHWWISLCTNNKLIEYTMYIVIYYF
jgi:hypothetical protein